MNKYIPQAGYNFLLFNYCKTLRMSHTSGWLILMPLIKLEPGPPTFQRMMASETKVNGVVGTNGVSGILVLRNP